MPFKIRLICKTSRSGLYPSLNTMFKTVLSLLLTAPPSVTPLMIRSSSSSENSFLSGQGEPFHALKIIENHFFSSTHLSTDPQLFKCFLGGIDSVLWICLFSCCFVHFLIWRRQSQVEIVQKTNDSLRKREDIYKCVL